MHRFLFKIVERKKKIIVNLLKLTKPFFRQQIEMVFKEFVNMLSFLLQYQMRDRRTIPTVVRAAHERLVCGRLAVSFKQIGS